MKNLRILIISILLLACSPQGLSTTPVPNSTAIKFTVTPNTPVPTKTITPTSSAPTELGFQLPPDCSIYDPSINSGYYADLSHGACNHPAISPNKSQIVYASLVITESGEIIQEARLFSISLDKSLSIYRSDCGILYPEWATTNYIVISDYPQDVGCGHTVVYDVTKDEIIANLNGAARRSWRSYWSEDKSAFFTLSPEAFGPVCSETLSGYSLISNHPVSTIKPIASNTNLYVVIGKPVWSKDGNTLLAAIRDGTCNDLEKYECTYSNSYIVSIDFSGDSPTVTYPFYDPEMDYSFVKPDEGNLEVTSTPTKTVTCWDVEIEESKQ
jgi:hypothetical protein